MVVVQIRAHSGNTVTITVFSHMEVFDMFSYANTAPMNQPESQAWDAWIKKIQKHSGMGRIRVKVLELLSKWSKKLFIERSRTLLVTSRIRPVNGSIEHSLIQSVAYATICYY